MLRIVAPVFVATFALVAPAERERTATPMSDLLRRIDHLVYASPDLDVAVENVERLVGVRASAGGQHPGRGTRNFLVSLGPATYLEIIGPDREQPTPPSPRTFGIDALSEARLVTWAAKGTELSELAQRAAGHGIRLGAVGKGSRRRPDGVLLNWQFTSPLTVVEDGIVPFFIDWGSTDHPARTAAKGASLVALRAEHPAPGRVQGVLRQLGLSLEVTRGSKPALVATIEGARGRVELR